MHEHAVKTNTSLAKTWHTDSKKSDRGVHLKLPSFDFSVDFYEARDPWVVDDAGHQSVHPQLKQALEQRPDVLLVGFGHHLGGFGSSTTGLPEEFSDPTFFNVTYDEQEVMS